MSAKSVKQTSNNHSCCPRTVSEHFNYCSSLTSCSGSVTFSTRGVCSGIFQATEPFSPSVKLYYLV